MLEPLLSIKETAGQLKICVRGVYRRIDEGLLPKPSKIGRRSLMPEAAIAEYQRSVAGKKLVKGEKT